MLPLMMLRIGLFVISFGTYINTRIYPNISKKNLLGRRILHLNHKKVMSTSDECGHCGVIVKNEDPALECGGACKRWYHLKCNSAEYSAFWKCVQAGAAYLVTLLCKMMFLATFFPASDSVSGQFDIIGEFLKATVDLADLFGLYLIMSQIAGKGQLKFMIAGVGWSLAELITGFLLLWVGARGIEFDWKYIQMGLGSNVNLVQHIATAMLVWLYSRTDLNRTSIPIVIILLGLSCYRPFLVEILIHLFGLGSWTLLLVKTFLTAGIGLVTLQMYLGLSTNKDANTYY